ncbi:hypothetical protein HN011_006997 [Eciton burchellii]|nr:hypothetical protein HN011_006997 [Eciton burchellii]
MRQARAQPMHADRSGPARAKVTEPRLCLRCYPARRVYRRGELGSNRAGYRTIEQGRIVIISWEYTTRLSRYTLDFMAFMTSGVSSARGNDTSSVPAYGQQTEIIHTEDARRMQTNVSIIFVRSFSSTCRLRVMFPFFGASSTVFCRGKASLSQSERLNLDATIIVTFHRSVMKIVVEKSLSRCEIQTSRYSSIFKRLGSGKLSTSRKRFYRETSNAFHVACCFRLLDSRK